MHTKSYFEPNDGFGFREGENAIGMDAEEMALWSKVRDESERAGIMQRRDARRLREHKTGRGRPGQ